MKLCFVGMTLPSLSPHTLWLRACPATGLHGATHRPAMAWTWVSTSPADTPSRSLRLAARPLPVLLLVEEVMENIERVRPRLSLLLLLLEGMEMSEPLRRRLLVLKAMKMREPLRRRLLVLLVEDASEKREERELLLRRRCVAAGGGGEGVDGTTFLSACPSKREKGGSARPYS